MFELLFKYSEATFERGEFLFASGWPLWPLILLVIAGAVAVGFSLVKNRHDFSWPKLTVLGVLQVALWATLLTMLWRPALLTQTLRPQENSIAVLVDTSASMGYGENTDRSRLQQAVAALEDGPLPDLQEQFDVELLSFAEQTIGLESLENVPPPGPKTDIAQALLSVLRGASAGALAAVVLVSDGADNAGSLDPARIAEIASFGVPVHTLGVGREVLEEDIELEDVIVAPQSAPGATVSAQVSIRHGRAANAQLKVYDGDAILASETIALPDQAGVTTRWIDIDVGSAGVRDLRFTIDPVGAETNLVNNTQLRPMEVPQQRRSVLYIEGEPRWEYKFMRRAMDADSPLRLASLLRTTPNKHYRQGIATP
ncbi:MAG: VWA domain-containing protein, partial [Gammaproteobacteria bacterium]|nr:VWA domain-containing protein [Gammaproteobacteria bacterium]